MRNRYGAVLGSVLIALTACDAGSVVDSPELGAPTVDVGRPLFSGGTCYQYTAPIWLGSMPTDPSVIAMNCGPETCGTPQGGEGLDVLVDPDGWTDVAVIRCPGGSIFNMPSSHPCWDCVEGCAGSACPEGALCSTIPGLYGSDCQAFTCPEGYQLVHAGVLQPPTCRRPCPPPIEVTIIGPTEIEPGGQCTWTAQASGGSGSYTYNWYNENIWQGTGQYYTGGRPDGTIHPQFRVRVDVWDGSTGASDQILVVEDPNAMLCPI